MNTKTMTNWTQDDLLEILREVDFGRLHKTMCFLGWTWMHEDGENRVPSEAQLRVAACRLLDEALAAWNLSGESYSIKSGGLEAYIGSDEISIKFVLEDGIRASDELSTH